MPEQFIGTINQMHIHVGAVRSARDLIGSTRQFGAILLLSRLSSGVYASAGDRLDAGRCLSTFASSLAAPFGAYARNRRSIRKRLPSDADCTGRTTGIECGVRNVSLVNIEKVARGWGKSLLELFSHL